ncbi:hypothetical protein EJ04DRAFT_511528 [Polyplosphaeria fusca]|uniref:DUF7580 domain-containing protein n=1 Tax=Polyplosphaeria fusca TaxID=682080 RepID=A0A9P4QY17_9PLEO|nr:hypothetical protein EJ04DRAFT_511528 [Polyplosphaeria fusca]
MEIWCFFTSIHSWQNKVKEPRNVVDSRSASSTFSLPQQMAFPLPDRRSAFANQLASYQGHRNQRYASVNVLLLSWSANDLPICEERDALEEMFRQIFIYGTERYEIPSKRSEELLGKALEQFLKRHGAPDSLVIVHYGGHGGPPKDGSTECEWAARIDEDSPTLDWSVVQTQLLTAECDVVILLDCCFAGSAARGQTRKCVEILLATDKDQIAPVGIGRWPSFTKILTEKMKELMDERGEVSLRSLHSRMVQADAGLRRQPILVAGRGSGGNILLRKCTLVPGPTALDMIQSGISPFTKEQSLMLEVYTHRPLESTVLEAILAWLTKGSPSQVASIRLAEDVVSSTASTRAVGNHLIRAAAHSNGSSPIVSTSVRSDLERLLNQVDEITSAPSPKSLTDEESVQLVRVLKEKSQSVNTMIGDLLANLDKQNLEEVYARKDVNHAELRDRINMRLKLLDTDLGSESKDVVVTFVAPPEEGQRFRVGKRDGYEVLVEYFYLHDRLKDLSISLSKQIARMSALLMENKPSSFNTLPGDGYLQERTFGPRIGFVYRKPDHSSIGRYSILSNLINSFGHVPLEMRARLATAICKAVLQLHSIGWYHKAIRSSNIVIFSAPDPEAKGIGQYAIDHPYLFGFDCSRPADAETWHTVDFGVKDNLYRHPDRWGVSGRFQSHHELYSLGILLLEIGCWRLLPQMDPTKSEFENIKHPQRLREFLLSKAMDRLAHYAGTKYAASVRACLEKRDWVGMEEWQIQGFIRANVLAGLEFLC